jgi:hypothetical protein
MKRSPGNMPARAKRFLNKLVRTEVFHTELYVNRNEKDRSVGKDSGLWPGGRDPRGES